MERAFDSSTQAGIMSADNEWCQSPRAADCTVGQVRAVINLQARGFAASRFPNVLALADEVIE